MADLNPGAIRISVPRQDVGVLGLSDDVTACLFDLEGVLTDTAAGPDRVWTEMVDAHRADRAELVQR